MDDFRILPKKGDVPVEDDPWERQEVDGRVLFGSRRFAVDAGVDDGSKRDGRVDEGDGEAMVRKRVKASYSKKMEKKNVVKVTCFGLVDWLNYPPICSC